MRVFSVCIPDKPLTNIELSTYAWELEVRSVFMRDMLPLYTFNLETGIVNLNTSNKAGSHWVCYYRSKTDRIYFDSYGQITPVEIQRYLKTCSGFGSWKGSYTEKYRYHTSCKCISVWPPLLMLKSLANSEQFQTILNHMQHYGYPQGDWKDSI